jgi:hypothetical protein
MPTIKTSYRFLIVITVAAAICLLGTSDAHAQTPPADFRIVDVRAEYGQMVVEVQHFMPDGSHAYFEHYTFQGREEQTRPLVRDSNDNLFLEETNALAPSEGP